MFKSFLLELNISAVQTNYIFAVNSNDLNTIRLDLVIKDNAALVDLTGKIVRLAIRKPDNTVVFQSGGVTDGPGGKCEFILSKQAALVPGRHEGEVMIYEGDSTVAVTTKFFYEVKRAVLSNIDIESSSDFPAISQAIAAGEILKEIDIHSVIEAGAIAGGVQEEMNLAKQKDDGTLFGTVQERLNDADEQLKITNDKLSQTDKIIISPNSFGAIGDGITDDTTSVQNTILFAQETGAIVDGLGKNYLISDVMGAIPSNAGSFREDYGLYISKSITIKNIKFKLKNACKDYTSVINIYSPKGTFVNLDNVKIDGNKDNQTHSASREDGGMHGIRVYGDTVLSQTGFIHINKCEVNNNETDGLLIRGITPDSIIVENSNFLKNTRNGFTDNTLDNIAIRNCRFEETVGTAPQSGYHCEPDSYLLFKNRIIENCKSFNNGTDGFRFDIRPGSIDGLIIKDCVTDQGISIVMESTAAKIRTYKNIDIVGCKARDIYFSMNVSSAGLGIGGYENISIKDCKVSTKYYMKSQDAAVSKGITFSNCEGLIYFIGNFDGIDIDNIRYKSLADNDKGIECNVFAGNRNYYVKNMNVNNLKYDQADGKTGQTGIHIIGDFNENITIENSKFWSEVYSIHIEAKNVLIDGNKFNLRGSSNYFVRAELSDNVTFINNTQVNKKRDGSIPTNGSQGKNYLPDNSLVNNNTLL